MRIEVLTDFDRASETVKSLATFAGVDHGAVGAWLLRDTATMRRFGVETLVPRWIRRPLAALRAFEEAHREATLALEAARDGLAGIESRLIGLRAAGKRAEAQTLEREAARLLCFEADLRERLAPLDAELVEQARQGITRVLEISMPILARAIVRYADAALDGEPGEVRRALEYVEAYLVLAKRARAVTGGLDVPALRPDYLARLRQRAGPLMLTPRISLNPRQGGLRAATFHPGGRPVREAGALSPKDPTQWRERLEEAPSSWLQRGDASWDVQGSSSPS